jgi:hypothetical protein
MTESHLLAASGSGGSGATWVWVLLAVAAYWVPTLTAVLRGVRNWGSVIVVNLFLGWTLIGWVVALAMACRSRERQPAYAQAPPG